MCKEDSVQSESEANMFPDKRKVRECIPLEFHDKKYQRGVLGCRKNNLDGRIDLQRRMESAIKCECMGNGREQVLTSVRRKACGSSKPEEQRTRWESQRERERLHGAEMVPGSLAPHRGVPRVRVWPPD